MTFDATTCPLGYPCTQQGRIEILGDVDFEYDETIELEITDGSGSIDPDWTSSCHTITITNDDNPFIQFDQTASSVNEDAGTHSVDITVLAAPTTDVTATINAKHITTSNDDYTLTTTSVVFTTAETYPLTKTISLTIDDDCFDDDSEQFILDFTASAGVQINADNDTHTVTINDNDLKPQITFDGATVSVSEAGNVQVDVQLNGIFCEAVEVIITDSSKGDAASGTDYVPFAPQTLTFNASGTQSVTVNTIEDAIEECPETILLHLTVLNGDALIGEATHVITITNNDNTPGLFLGCDNANWFNASNWADNVIPNASTNIQFGAESKQAVIQIDQAGAVANDITLASGQEIDLIDAAARLTVEGDLTLADGATIDIIPSAELTLKGDFTDNNVSNDGLLTAGQASVRFAGTTPQTVTTQNTLGLHKLVMDGAGVTVNQDITIESVLEFFNGILTLPSDKSLTLATGIGATNLGTSTAYLNGTVNFATNSTGTFFLPVGSSTDYAPVEITPLNGNQMDFTLTYNDAGLGTYDIDAASVGLDHVSTAEYWDLDLTNAPLVQQVTLKLYWGAHSSVSENSADWNDLVLVHHDGTDWDQLANTNVDGSSANFGSVTATATEYSPFTFGSSSANNPLPVTWLDFNLSLNETNTVDVEWSTAAEINNDYFEVQRSFNGVDFTTIEIVEGAGNTIQKSNYKVEDINAQAGVNYYRIAQVDFDGTTDYSDIRQIALALPNFEVSVYPNPTQGMVYFKMNQETAGVPYQVLNAQGQQIDAGVLITNDQLNMANYANGIYQIMIANQPAIKIMKY